MRLASKGLGKITLPFRFTEARISEATDCLVLEGTIKEKKVNWTYRAELEDSDILDFAILAHRPAVARYIAEHAGVAVFAEAARAAARLLGSFLGFSHVSLKGGVNGDNVVAGSRRGAQ